MSRKTLWMLAVVLAALLGALWLSKRAAPAADEAAAAKPGKLLAAVDLAAVVRMTIADQAATTHLAQADGVWRVQEQGDYPADLERLRNLMRMLDEAEEGQVADAGAERLAEYGLGADASNAPVRIALDHGQATTVLALGKTREPQRSEQPFWGPPPGRFARVDEGPVRLLKDDVPLAQADPALWWERKLLEVPADAIQQVAVTLPQESYSVQRDTNGLFRLADSAEEADLAAANRLFGALRSLRADRFLTNEVAESWFANASRYQATTTNGASVEIRIGESQPDMEGGRPVQIQIAAVAGEASALPPEFAAVEKKLNGRTYLVPAYATESLALAKETVVKKPAPPAEPPAAPPSEPAVESPAAPSAETTAAPEVEPAVVPIEEPAFAPASEPAETPGEPPAPPPVPEGT